MSFAIITSIVAVVSVLGSIAAVAGFRTSSKREHSATWWWLMGSICMIVAANSRALYWDVLWTTLRDYNRPLADAWSEAVGGTAVNILFHLPMLFGIYCMMKSRQAMIDEDEVKDWPWYLAWMHPKTIRMFRWPRSR